MPSIEDVPAYWATYWGISTLAAQVLLSTIVFMMVMIPILILTKGQNQTVNAVAIIFTEAVLVGIAWLDSWIMILTVVVIVLLFANKISGLVVGG